MAEEPVPAARQRKKRKWDQPAEVVVSPAMSMPMMQFGGVNPLTTLGMPSMMTMMSNYMGLMAPMNVAAAPLPQPNSAAAIVQKINQELIAKGLMLPSKVHDEVISREIVINDADPGVRYKLTKRQTQEEIQAKTGAVVITRGRFRPPNGPPDLEKPLYLHISAGVQLKDTAERIKAVDAATALVEGMMKQGPSAAGALQSGAGGPAFSAIVNVGIEADPSFNLIGRIRGPNDQYIKHIMTETGAEVIPRGRGSGYIDPTSGEELQQPLHLFISSDNAKSLDDARRLSESLLDTIRADNISFRPVIPQPTASGPPPMYNSPSMGQYTYHQSSGLYPTQVGFQNPRAPFQASGYLPGSQPPIPGVPPLAAAPPRNLMDPYANMRPPSKSYAAVPPPQQLLVGGALDAVTDSSSTLRSSSDTRPGVQEVHETPTASTSFATTSMATSAAHVPVASSTGLSQPLNFRPQNNSPNGAVPYSNPSYPVPAPTYGGYGGFYPPQVSPLQPATSVLQRPPLPVTIRPGLAGSSSAGVFPPGTEGAVPASHHSEKSFTGPVQKERRKFQEFPVAAKTIAPTEVPIKHPIAGVAKQDPTGVKMPPPPPKVIPPPPPKFASFDATGVKMPPPPPKPAPQAPKEGEASDKERDAGLKLVEYGEEDDDDAPEQQQIKAEIARPNGKPFWAA